MNTLADREQPADVVAQAEDGHALFVGYARIPSKTPEP